MHVYHPGYSYILGSTLVREMYAKKVLTTALFIINAFIYM